MLIFSNHRLIYCTLISTLHEMRMEIETSTNAKLYMVAELPIPCDSSLIHNMSILGTARDHIITYTTSRAIT